MQERINNDAVIAEEPAVKEEQCPVCFAKQIVLETLPMVADLLQREVITMSTSEEFDLDHLEYVLAMSKTTNEVVEELYELIQRLSKCDCEDAPPPQDEDADVLDDFVSYESSEDIANREYD